MYSTKDGPYSTVTVATGNPLFLAMVYQVCFNRQESKDQRKIRDKLKTLALFNSSMSGTLFQISSANVSLAPNGIFQIVIPHILED